MLGIVISMILHWGKNLLKVLKKCCFADQDDVKRPKKSGRPQLLEILESPGKISISLNILETPWKIEKMAFSPWKLLENILKFWYFGLIKIFNEILNSNILMHFQLGVSENVSRAEKVYEVKFILIGIKMQNQIKPQIFTTSFVI